MLIEFFPSLAWFVTRSLLCLIRVGARIAELAEEGQRAQSKLKSALAMQKSLVQRANDMVGVLRLKYPFRFGCFLLPCEGAAFSYSVRCVFAWLSGFGSFVLGSVCQRIAL